MDKAAFDELYRGQQQSMDESDWVTVKGLPGKMPRAAWGSGTENIATQVGEIVESVNRKTGERRRGVVTHVVKNRILCKGNLKLWTMDSALSEKVRNAL